MKWGFINCIYIFGLRNGIQRVLNKKDLLGKNISFFFPIHLLHNERRQKMYKHVGMIAVYLTLTGFLGACGPDNQEATYVSISVPLTNDECQVTSASAMITASDMEPMGPLELAVTNERITGKLENVPEGLDREVTVQAFNQEKLVVYAGTGKVDVSSGETTHLYLTLYRNFDHCPMSDSTGSINIIGSLDNARGYPFDFYQAELDETGIMYLYNNSTNIINRYDTNTARLLEPLTGFTDTTAMTVDPDGDLVAFLAYEGGRIEAFDTKAQRFYFNSSPSGVSSMKTVGPYLFTTGSGSANDSHSLYELSTGTHKFTQENRARVFDAVYAPSLHRLFYMGQYWSQIHMTDIDLEKGILGLEIKNPDLEDETISAPLRLSPDEATLAVASGILLDTSDLSIKADFGLTYVDLAFHQNDYYLIRQSDYMATQLLKINSSMEIVSTHKFRGSPKRLFVQGENLILLTRFNAGSASKTVIWSIPLTQL